MTKTVENDLIELKKLQTCLTKVKEIENQIQENQAALEESAKELNSAQIATFPQKNENYNHRLSIENEDKKQRQQKSVINVHTCYLLFSLIYAFITHFFIDVQSSSNMFEISLVESLKEFIFPELAESTLIVLLAELIYYLGIILLGSFFYYLSIPKELESDSLAISRGLIVFLGFIPASLSLLLTFSTQYMITIIHALITTIFICFVRPQRTKKLKTYTPDYVKQLLEKAKQDDINAEDNWKTEQNEIIETLTQEHENVKLSAPQNIERLEKEKELLDQSIKKSIL